MMIRVLALLLIMAASSAYGEVFTWTDKRGTRHYTNSVYEIPERYRSRVKILDIPTGKRLAPTPAQLSGQSQPANPGQQTPGPANPALMPPQPQAPPQPQVAPQQQVAPAQPAPALQNERPAVRERLEQRKGRQRRGRSSDPEE